MTTFLFPAPRTARLIRTWVWYALALAGGPAPLLLEAQQLPVDSAVKVGTLPNGVRYYVRANAQPQKRAELRLVINAGSVLEDADQRGLAHMVEHMAFNGTRNFAKQEIVNYLESIGMQFGADLNAYTSFDETVYMLQVPTDTGTALAKGIQILEEWAHLVTFDTLEVNKERGVVIEEWRLGRGAEARMRDSVFPVLFKNSRYAERLPIGDKSTLEGFRPETLRRFYRDWYRPDLMAVVAVGDFDPVQVERMIREHFERVPAAKAARARPEYPVPDHAETLVTIVTDAEATSTSVEVYQKLPKRDEGTVAAYRAGLVDYLYASMLNARLSELTQQSDPPFIGAGGGRGSLIRSKDVMSIGAGVAETGVERGLEAILTEAERASRHGFSASEFDREKTRLLRFYETAYAERAKSESGQFADEYARNFLEQEPIPGIAFEYDLVKRLLPEIQKSEIDAVARGWSAEPNRVIVLQAPRKPGLTLPGRDRLLAVFDAVKQKQIPAYVDRIAAGPLVAKPPRPGQIVAEKKVADVGVTIWELSNGARVMLKPTDFKDDEVLFSAASPGGHSLASDRAHTSAAFSSLLVSLSGVGTYSAVELGKALAGKAIDVRPYIAETREGLSGSGSPKDIRTLFELAHLYFTAPRKDSTSYESYRTRLSAIIANRDASPETPFWDTLQVTLAQHHPRARPLTPALLRELDLEQAISFYRERFADAGDFMFTLVGSFTLDSIRPLVEQYLASLPSNRRVERARDVGMRPPAGVITRAVRRGREPKSQTQIVFTGPFTYTRAERHALASLIDVLDIRLREVLREDLSGTYGVSINQTSSREPYPHYAVYINFGAAPERLDSLAAAVFDIIEQMKRDGPSATDLAKIKETQRRSFEKGLRENSFWASQLMARAENGEELTNILTFPALVDALTAEQVRDTARKHLRKDNYVRVSLFPEGPQ
ncbi:MAG TPA: insulinase family protein [Longimicrobiales bacterium]|nr:insulinase family protein [Longimicrobiales bacterium]